MLYLSSFKMFLLKVRELREQLRKREQLEGELEAMRNQVNTWCQVVKYTFHTHARFLGPSHRRVKCPKAN